MSGGEMIAVAAVLGCVALFAAWLAVEAIHRRPEVGALSLFLWLAVSVAFPDHPEWFQRTVGGINVTVPDVLCALLGLVAALRCARGLVALPRDAGIPLLAVAGLLALGYVRGVSAVGLQHATNEFREFFYFLAALAFSLSFPFSRLGRLLPGATVAGGALLTGVAVVHLAASRQLDIDHRPLPSFGALAVGEAFLLGWFWLRTKPPRIWRWLVFSFLPVSFFMLHRSVWMCLLVGLAGLFVLDPAGRGRLTRILVVGGLAATLAVALFFQAEVARGLDGAVAEASSQHSTFLWRIQGWTALLATDSESHSSDLIWGRPMGSGYARTLGDSVVDSPQVGAGVIPHNYYVSLLLRGGALGLGAFLLLYAILFRNLLRLRRQDPADPFPAAFLVILAVQMVYYIPYSADVIQGLLLGGAVALSAAERVPRTAPLFACASPS